MTKPDKRVAVLSPVARRTPPRQYGAWETVASNITEGLVDGEVAINEERHRQRPPADPVTVVANSDEQWAGAARR